MFGENGWLEKTGQTPEKKKDPQKKSMFEGIKKIAKGLVSRTLFIAVGSLAGLKSILPEIL